jgi:hypothetical protein
MQPPFVFGSFHQRESSEPIQPNLVEPESTISNPTPQDRVNARFRNYLSLAMNPVTRAQALSLYATYPQSVNADIDSMDATREMQAIHRALAKITYAQLMPVVKRFATLQNQPGNDPKLIPPLIRWFDGECWHDVN